MTNNVQLNLNAHVPYTAKLLRGKTHSFSLNCKCFPTNYGLVDWQCKSTSMLPQKFSSEWHFYTLTMKVLPYTVLPIECQICISTVLIVYSTHLVPTIQTC